MHRLLRRAWGKGLAVGVAAVMPVSYKFVLLDLTGIALFVVFLAMAIGAAKRRDIGMHLRLIACTAIIPLQAANERTAI